MPVDNEFINSLFDPDFEPEIGACDRVETDILQKMLRSMLFIREVEQKLAVERRDGLIKGPVHLGVGQEAIAVGISQNLRKTDRVFGGHRSHSHILALNPDARQIFAEVLGKVTGFSKGMGGSMHLTDPVNGFLGSVPIVAGTIPLAVGASLAAKMQKTSDIGVCYFGDGAAEEGVFQESMNLAKVLKTPTLFVVENNLYASHMHISQRQPQQKISRFASVNNVPYQTIDGNDAISIFEISRDIISDIRKGLGPALLELISYRWYGHVDWREDIDVGISRSADEVLKWRKKDPVARLIKSMKRSGILTEEYLENVINEVGSTVQDSWEKALSDEYPDLSTTSNCVYSK